MVKSDKRSKLEAKVVAAFVTLGCLVFFIQVVGPQKQPPPRRVNYVPVPVSVPTPQPSIEERTHAIDPNEQHHTTKFVSTDEVDLKNYTPQIYINE